jgi:hypothetical protein
MKRSTTHNIELDPNEIKAIIAEHVVRSGNYNPNDKFDISFKIESIPDNGDCAFPTKVLTGCKISITLS